MSASPYAEQVMSSIAGDTFIQLKKFGDDGRFVCSGYLKAVNPRKMMIVPMTEDGQFLMKSSPLHGGEQDEILSGIFVDYDSKYSVWEMMRSAVWEELEVPVVNGAKIHQSYVLSAKTNMKCLLVIAVVSGFVSSTDKTEWKSYPASSVIVPEWGVQDSLVSFALSQFLSPMALCPGVDHLNAEMKLGFYGAHLESKGIGDKSIIECNEMSLSGRRLYDMERGRDLYGKIQKAITEVAL